MSWIMVGTETRVISKRKLILSFIIYAIIDIVCVGMGMGVPFFCILFGGLVGWYIVKHLCNTKQPPADAMHRVLKYAMIASAFTFFLMVVIWGRMIVMVADSATDYQNFGHPFILYDPKLSFVGWLVLMIFISPFLQLLVIIFTSFITLWMGLKQRNTNT